MEYKDEDTAGRIAQLENIVWKGTISPSIISRLAEIETRARLAAAAVLSIEQKLNKFQDKMDKLTAIVSIGMGIIVTLQFLLKR